MKTDAINWASFTRFLCSTVLCSTVGFVGVAITMFSACYNSCTWAGILYGLAFFSPLFFPTILSVFGLVMVLRKNVPPRWFVQLLIVSCLVVTALAVWALVADPGDAWLSGSVLVVSLVMVAPGLFEFWATPIEIE